VAVGKRSSERALQKVLGQGGNVNAANPLEVHDPKVGSLISYEGTTTADGAGDGSSLIDSVLTTKPNYNGNLVIITSGAYAGQGSDINGATTAGTVTAHTAFDGQILRGTKFVIVGIRTVPAEVAALTALVIALMADVGDPTGETLGSLAAKWGDIARSLDLILGARWDAGSDLGTDIAAIIASLATIAGYLDTEIAAIETKLDTPANFMADVSALALETTLGTHDTDIKNVLTTIAAYIDTEIAAIITSLGNVKTETDQLPNWQSETEWTSTPTVEQVGNAAAVALTAGSITPTYPTGATRVRAILIATIHCANQAANTHHIHFKVEGQKAAGGYGDLLDLTAVDSLAMVNVDGATDGWCGAIDVTALVDTSGAAYDFRFEVDSDNAGNVNYTCGFVLVLVYTM